MLKTRAFQLFGGDKSAPKPRTFAFRLPYVAQKRLCLSYQFRSIVSYRGPLIGLPKLSQTTISTANENVAKQKVQWPCTCVLSLVHFWALFCKTVTWNDQILRFVENANHTANFSNFLFRIERDQQRQGDGLLAEDSSAWHFLIDVHLAISPWWFCKVPNFSLWRTIVFYCTDKK